MRKVLFIYFILNFFNSAASQNSNDFYNKFIQDLINKSPDLEEYFSKEDAANSSRLGISYENVKWKFLISRDIDIENKNKVLVTPDSYKLQTNKINETTEEVIFSLDNPVYRQRFYFENGKLISPLTFYTKTWKNLTSKYFKFFISDTNYFNNYCMTRLDNFVDSTLTLLNVSNDGRLLLEKEKILYVMCKDENEIEMVTGFNTRGMFILADDAIVSTYNYHIHEIAHLLINFRLKSLPLFTLPFVQEGFAVAVGGRGGLSSNVLMDVGYFLLESNILRTNSVFSLNDFQSEDPSITYSVSGILNYFMLNEMNIEKYLNVYRKLSGDSKFITDFDSNEVASILNFDFTSSMEKYKQKGGIDFEVSGKSSDPIYSKGGNEIIEVDEYYLFRIRTPLLMSTKTPLINYQSKKFIELFSGTKYNGEKYFLSVSDSEIKLHNLYCNELIASYDAGFSEGKTEFKKSYGYEFFISKTLFEENLSELLMIAFQ